MDAELEFFIGKICSLSRATILDLSKNKEKNFCLQFDKIDYIMDVFSDNLKSTVHMREESKGFYFT